MQIQMDCFSKENLLINSLTMCEAQIIAFKLTTENDQRQFRKVPGYNFITNKLTNELVNKKLIN